MIFCLADLPFPPAALRETANPLVMAMHFIQCAGMIMKASLVMIVQFLSIFRMPLNLVVYVFGPALTFSRVGVAECPKLNLNLS